MVCALRCAWRIRWHLRVRGAKAWTHAGVWDDMPGGIYGMGRLGTAGAVAEELFSSVGFNVGGYYGGIVAEIVFELVFNFGCD